MKLRSLSLNLSFEGKIYRKNTVKFRVQSLFLYRCPYCYRFNCSLLFENVVFLLILFTFWLIEQIHSMHWIYYFMEKFTLCLYLNAKWEESLKHFNGNPGCRLCQNEWVKWKIESQNIKEGTNWCRCCCRRFFNSITQLTSEQNIGLKKRTNRAK